MVGYRVDRKLPSFGPAVVRDNQMLSNGPGPTVLDRAGSFCSLNKNARSGAAPGLFVGNARSRSRHFGATRPGSR